MMRAPGLLLPLLVLAMPASAAEHRVVIEAMAFVPNVVQARPGDTIVWENRDVVAHNVHASAARLNSPNFAPGRSWRLTIPRRARSFDYLCTLHPVMRGRVELQR